MPKIFPVIVRKTYGDVVITPPTDTGEVTTEKLTYDRPEIAPRPTPTLALQMAIAESVPYPMDEAVAAILAQAYEDAPYPQEVGTVQVTANAMEAAPAALDVAALVAAVAESMPLPIDTQRLELNIAEPVPVPVETLALPLAVAEIAPQANDAASATITAAPELVALPADLQALELLDAEASPIPVEAANILASVTVLEVALDAAAVEAAIAAVAEASPGTTEAVTMTLTFKPGVPTITQEAATRSDWATITNAQGRPNGANATFAGNLLGARSGRIVGAFPSAPTGIAANFTITSAILQFYGTTQVPIAVQPTLKLGYRINTGALVEVAAPGVANSTVDFSSTPITFDLTSVIGGSWTVIPTIQAYAAASTPLGNASNHTIDAFVLVVTATRTEP